MTGRQNSASGNLPQKRLEFVDEKAGIIEGDLKGLRIENVSING